MLVQIVDRVQSKNYGALGPICLIVPPSEFLLDERVFMSLGILRIASVLETQGCPVEVLDLAGYVNYLDAVQWHSLTTQATLFGITATTPQLPAAVKIASTIKRERPDARVILGGPHATLVNAARKKECVERPGRATSAMGDLERSFDVVVAGDGERAIFNACEDVALKLIDADDPKSPLFLKDADLDQLPFPARHLVNVDSYHYFIDEHRAYSLIAQLGCPFECGFCGGRLSPMLRRVRTRTAQSIVAEMVHMYETIGCTGFMFYDDELNVNRKMVELMNLIADTQRKLGVEWRLRGFVKAELFTEEQAEAMYRAGFRWILTGFESGSPRILSNINKKATREENSKCVQIARKHGLKVKALMSVGHPGETEATILETRDWLLEAKPEAFDLTIITCYPGTPYYDEALPTSDSRVWQYVHKKTGDSIFQVEVDFTKVADYYKGDPNGGYTAYVFTETLSREDLVRLRGEVEAQVREKLRIPYDTGAPALRYEHSMGQMGPLPSNILRVSAGTRIS